MARLAGMVRLAVCAAFVAGVSIAAHAQWQLETSNTPADLRGIHSIGNGVAWASGTNGTVLRTEDGGYVWQTCTVPPGAEELDFRGIQGLDANTAIVMSSGKGDLSRLYKTTDGCHSWKLLFKNPDKDGFWDAIVFSHNEGWLLGDPVRGSFVLFVTEDGGRTWTRQRNKGLKADANKQGAFAASNSSLLPGPAFVSGGSDGAYEYSIISVEICLDDCPDRDIDHEGRRSTWRRLSIPVGSDSESSGAFSIGEQTLPIGSLHGKVGLVAVGGDFRKPDSPLSTAAFFVGGGETWHPAQTPPHGYRSSVAYDAAHNTWITVGPNGTDISTDDGRNWRPLRPDAARSEAGDADRKWNAISLPFVVGPKGRIGKLNQTAMLRQAQSRVAGTRIRLTNPP